MLPEGNMLSEPTRQVNVVNDRDDCAVAEMGAEVYQSRWTRLLAYGGVRSRHIGNTKKGSGLAVCLQGTEDVFALCGDQEARADPSAHVNAC